MKLRGWKILPVVALTLLTACGKTSSYSKQSQSAVSVAAQYTKPKIDVVLFQDNSSSMVAPNSTIKGQLNSFLSGLSASWDFRFIVLPLQATPALSSKYIMAKDCTGIPTGSSGFYYCLDSSQASTFINAPGDYGFINSTNTGTGNTDLGFQTMQSNLNNLSLKSFARHDAALAVVVVSNGEDVSGISYYDPDGDGTPQIDYNSATSQNSFNSFKNYMSGMIGGTGLLRFYSVVANNSYSNCYGGPAWQGYRYMSMSAALNSPYYELCSNGISSALYDIGAQINAMIQSIVFNYAVIDVEPSVSSIVVKKNGVVIPQGGANGWVYEGYKTNAYTSYLPQLGNAKTGYFIKLNGTAAYKGTEVITVDFEKK